MRVASEVEWGDLEHWNNLRQPTIDSLCMRDGQAMEN